MGPLRHLIVLAVIAAVFRWLWLSSLTERANLESGRTIFPPTRAFRTLFVFLCVALSGIFLWSWFALRKPDEWWVPYLFLAFLILQLCVYPPVLSIEVEGIGSRAWWRREKKLIRWEEIANLQYKTGNKQVIVRAKDGRKITHGGFNIDQGQFMNDVQERTHLPLKITKPGTWKSETYEVPYEGEGEDENEDSVSA